MSVIDDGPGIDEHIRPTLFVPYSQVDDLGRLRLLVDSLLFRLAQIRCGDLQACARAFGC